MKKLILAFLISFVAITAQAKNYLTIEYNAPEISGGGANTDFKTSKGLFGQIADFNNIALGANFRIHKNFGFNANWSQVEMENYSIFNVGSLSRKASLQIEHFNFSALAYLPVKKDLFELFAEFGIADINSKLTYVTSSGAVFAGKSHDTKALYGFGFQVHLTKSEALRLSFQKYSGKLSLLDSSYSTLRIGYLKAF